MLDDFKFLRRLLLLCYFSVFYSSPYSGRVIGFFPGLSSLEELELWPLTGYKIQLKNCMRFGIQALPFKMAFKDLLLN